MDGYFHDFENDLPIKLTESETGKIETFTSLRGKTARIIDKETIWTDTKKDQIKEIIFTQRYIDKPHAKDITHVSTFIMDGGNVAFMHTVSPENNLQSSFLNKTTMQQAA
jgi:hypothetical protein